MNHFKRITILVFGILFGVVFCCAAQNKSKKNPSKKEGPNKKYKSLSAYKYKKRTPEEKARYFTKKMVDSLTVSEAEEEALYKMNIVVSRKFDSLRTFVNTLDRRDRSAAYRSIYGYRDSCMKAILPIKEFLKFQDIERERYERKKARQRGEMKKEEN